MVDKTRINERAARALKVLVVDDEAIIRNMLQRGLNLAGYSTHTAQDGESALTLIEREEFDVIISDIRMSGRDGIWLLEHSKAICPDTAVIMLTGTADLDMAVSCLKKGAFDYILKPANADHVIIAVERAYDWRKLVLEHKDYQRNLEQKVAEKTRELSEMFLGSIMALSRSLDAKDPYTYGHSERVASLSLLIYRNLPVTSNEEDALRLAGMFHDLGKISVSDTILQKKEKLSPEEWENIQKHTIVSERILSEFIRDESITKAVRHHHERYDGKGYPDGLIGEDIPFLARIIAVADTYDALTSRRPYRGAFSPDAALKELISVKGTQLDPEVLEIFLKAMETTVKAENGNFTRAPHV